MHVLDMRGSYARFAVAASLHLEFLGFLTMLSQRCYPIDDHSSAVQERTQREAVKTLMAEQRR